MKKDIELWGFNRDTWEKFTVSLDTICKAINTGDDWSDDDFVYVTKGERDANYSIERSQYLKENSISRLYKKGEKEDEKNI